MDKKGKNQGRYGGGKGDDGGRFERREESSVNRRLRQQQDGAISSTFPTQRSQQQQHDTMDRDWESNSGYTSGSRSSAPYQRDKKPPLAGPINPAAILPNLPSNIESLPPRLKKKYLQEHGLPLDYFEKHHALVSQHNNINNNRAQTLPKGNRGSGNNRTYYQSKNLGPGRSQSPSDQLGDSRHSSRNSSLDRKYDSYESRRKSPDGYRSRGEWSQQKGSNFFNRNKRGGSNDERFGRYEDGRNGKAKDVLDWSHEVEQEESRKREGRSLEANFENGTRRRNRSNSRSNMDRDGRNRGGSERNFYNASEVHSFKMPFPKSNRSRSRRNSQSSVSRENSADRNFYRSNSGNRFSSSRENSLERYQTRDPTNWRTPITSTDTKIAEMTKKFVETVDLRDEKRPGMLVLPNSATLVRASEHQLANGDADHGNSVQKTLFDPKNPQRPIVVTQKAPRIQALPNLDGSEKRRNNRTSLCEPMAHPSWYDPSSEGYKRAHNPKLIEQLCRVDEELQQIVDSRELFRNWNRYNETRYIGQSILAEFLQTDLKFCEIENVEQHCWKLLFYNIIELLRKPLSENIDTEFYRKKLLEIIEPGQKYWESLLQLLEDKYKFKIEEFTGSNASARIYQNDLDEKKFVKLALVSVQKILLCLGDLARYKELINETNNFGKAKQYYTKAQQLLPKNGRPYNQLALISFYSKRKIDAVYFYMRSLMSSNPFLSARESLIALFDEIRKKYENSQKRREEKNRLRLKEKEHRFDGGQLRRETWIHPEGGSKLHRTAPLDPMAATQSADSGDEDMLNQLDTLEINKRFITSFLHVQGKLITKIGMESFLQCAIQMLREFRALIQHSPIAITCHRLLQLIALNMFAIDCSQLKDPLLIASGGRSEVQECAVIVGMLMFGIIIERFLHVVRESSQKSPSPSKETANSSNEENVKRHLDLPEDAKEMLPAIKVWCDWMVRQQSVWNPPPFYGDYKISANTNYDPWMGLTNLMNLLESADLQSSFSSCAAPDFELVKLHENVALAGFTPIDREYEPVYVHRTADMETSENDLRLLQILNFGRQVLCSCKPPVLISRTLDDGTVEYSNAVQNRPEESSDSEILLECFSDDDEEADDGNSSTLLLNAIKKGLNEDDTTPSDMQCQYNDDRGNGNMTNDNTAEIRRLLRRKDELERRQKMQEKYNQRIQDIMSASTIKLKIEVRPKFLVPDTNCFVDYLHHLKAIANAYPLYQLMVPLVVINELEGLSKGLKPSPGSSSENSFTALGVVPISASFIAIQSQRQQSDYRHAEKVAEESKNALTYLKTKPAAVKLVTTKGHQIKTFIASEDDDSTEQKSNDDKILDTALNLCRSHREEIKGDIRRIVREVVLITKDRNLRVKALSNDLPVRELPDFIKWAGLGS